MFDVFRKLKWFWQRGTRGYSDRDLWALNDYLARWLPDALRSYKTKRGIPAAYFTALDGDMTAEQEREAQARWHDALDRMIAGFEAYQRLSSFDYTAELGPCPDPCVEFTEVDAAGNHRGEVTAEARAYFARQDPLIARDQHTFDAGIHVFAENFDYLWD